MEKAMENTVKIMDRIKIGKTDKQLNEVKSLMTDNGAGMNIGAQKAIEQAGGMSNYLKQ